MALCKVQQCKVVVFRHDNLVLVFSITIILVLIFSLKVRLKTCGQAENLWTATFKSELFKSLS